MRVNLAAKMERAYRDEVERELSRTMAHDKPFIKGSGGDWAS
jgi:hypothetical protein